LISAEPVWEQSLVDDTAVDNMPAHGRFLHDIRDLRACRAGRRLARSPAENLTRSESTFPAWIRLLAVEIACGAPTTPDFDPYDAALG
jgi:hypothetical protein